MAENIIFWFVVTQKHRWNGSRIVEKLIAKPNGETNHTEK